MFLIAILFGFISVSVAFPNQDSENYDIMNIITAPANCPTGQQWNNGMCRDIWRIDQNVDLEAIGPSGDGNRNVITVPPNCPPGQELVNGVCRDIWRHLPLNAPSSEQFYDADLEQRDKRQVDTEVNVVNMLKDIPDIINRNIINIPNQCPAGYKPDAFGFCRQILA